MEDQIVMENQQVDFSCEGGAIQGTETGAKRIEAHLDNPCTGAFLTADQQNYAVGRINDLAQEQMAKFCEDNPLPSDVRPALSLDEKFELLRDGKATMKPLAKKKKACQLPGGDHTAWYQLFEFPKTDAQKEWDAARDLLNEYQKALEDKRDAAIDEVILGTGAAIGQIIAGFGVGAPDPRKAKPAA